MSERDNDYFEKDNDLQPLDSIEDINQDDDIFESIRKNMSQFEIRISFFYTIQKIEMILLTILSTASIIPLKSIKQYPEIETFHFMLKILLLSPSLFENSFFAYFVLFSILFAFLIFMGYVIYTMYISTKANQPNSSAFQIWIVFQRLFLPIPSVFIGNAIGHYFIELTKAYQPSALVTILILGFLWMWAVYASNYFYDSYQYQRKYDQCQINHHYLFFNTFVMIYPMMQTILPSLIKIFFHAYVPQVYCFFTSFFSFLTLIYVVVNTPYNFSSMNRLIVFLSLCRIPVSLIWLFEEKCPQHFVFCVLAILVSVIIMYFLLIVISCLCIKCNPHHNDPNNPNLAIALKAIEMKRRDSFSIPDFDPTQNCPMPFYLVLLQPQDICIYVFLAFTVTGMLLFNACAAERMPVANALPDIVHENFPISDAIRTSSSYGDFQISNVLIFFQIIVLFLSEFFARDYLNVRREAVLYGLIAFLRGISFLITGLPAPCAGHANCPCADPKILEGFKHSNIFAVSIQWLIGLGMILKLPQCGDLIISGHTMWLWLTTKTCSSVMNHALKKPFNYLASGIFYTLTLISMGYIIISRNHYSIDVWFGFLITEMCWIIYNLLQAKAMKPPKESDSTLVKIVRWLERRPPYRQLLQNKKLMGDSE